MFDFSNVMALFKANVKETILNTVDVKNNTINIVEHYLNKFNSLGFGFFMTETVIGNCVIKMFLQNDNFMGGAILINKVTKDFVFMSDFRLNNTKEFIVISNNINLESDIQEIINGHFNNIIVEGSFLQRPYYNILKLILSDFDKLNIGTKSLHILTILAFSKLEFNNISVPPAALKAGLIKVIEQKYRINPVRPDQARNYYLNDNLDWHVSVLLRRVIGSKQLGKYIPLIGIEILPMIKNVYFDYFNSRFPN